MLCCKFGWNVNTSMDNDLMNSIGIVLYHFQGEHKLFMKHKVRFDGKYTVIDRVDTMKHIGLISKHEYLYRTYTLVVGAEFNVKNENAIVHVGTMEIK